MTAIYVEVRGRVQGVGFRYTTQRTAHRLGVVGWVRNLPDGSVGVWVQGESGAVQRLQAFLQLGPRGAVVESISEKDVEPDLTLVRFDVRF